MVPVYNQANLWFVFRNWIWNS